MTQKTQEIAKDIFKRYPNGDKVFITSDGQAFFSEADAKNHALNNRAKKELTVETVLRSQIEEAVVVPEYAKNAKDTIADIQAAETTEAVTVILDSEKASGGPRKSVVEAAEKRITELQNK